MENVGKWNMLHIKKQTTVPKTNSQFAPEKVLVLRSVHPMKSWWVRIFDDFGNKPLIIYNLG